MEYCFSQSFVICGSKPSGVRSLSLPPTHTHKCPCHEKAMLITFIFRVAILQVTTQGSKQYLPGNFFLPDNIDQLTTQSWLRERWREEGEGGRERDREWKSLYSPILFSLKQTHPPSSRLETRDSNLAVDGQDAEDWSAWLVLTSPVFKMCWGQFWRLAIRDLFCFLEKISLQGAVGIAQWSRALVAVLDGQGVIPSTHVATHDHL